MCEGRFCQKCCSASIREGEGSNLIHRGPPLMGRFPGAWEDAAAGGGWRYFSGIVA